MTPNTPNAAPGRAKDWKATIALIDDRFMAGATDVATAEDWSRIRAVVAAGERSLTAADRPDATPGEGRGVVVTDEQVDTAGAVIWPNTWRNRYDDRWVQVRAALESALTTSGTGAGGVCGERPDTVLRAVARDAADFLSKSVNMIERQSDDDAGGYASQWDYDADQIVASLRIAIAEDEREESEYPECSGDPASCPENEGYGCCKSNPPTAPAEGEAVAWAPKDHFEAYMRGDKDATPPPVFVKHNMWSMPTVALYLHPPAAPVSPADTSGVTEESITLTVDEILSLAHFAGVPIDSSFDIGDDERETEITIEACPKDGLSDQDGDTITVSHFRLIAYNTEYPEEGSCGLGQEIESARTATGSARSVGGEGEAA